jgi:hypothetical protein
MVTGDIGNLIGLLLPLVLDVFHVEPMGVLAKR